MDAAVVQEWALTVLMLVGVVLASFLALVVAVIATNIQTKVKGWAERVDSNPAVLALGRSPIGQAGNQYLQQLLPQVDSPDDPLVKTFNNLKAIQYLKKNGLISDDFAASVLKSAVETGIRLTDGIPNVSVTVEKP